MAEKLSVFKRLSRYLREVKQELKKVTWPSKQEIISSTMVVIVAVFFFILLVGGLDFLFGKLVKLAAFRL
jgi:preprotein translocase subunit SecE